MNQFLERYSLAKLKQGKIDNINRPISMKEIELTITYQNKALGPSGFTGKFYQTFKEKMITILHNHF